MKRIFILVWLNLFQTESILKASFEPLQNVHFLLAASSKVTRLPKVFLNKRGCLNRAQETYFSTRTIMKNWKLVFLDTYSISRCECSWPNETNFMDFFQKLLILERFSQFVYFDPQTKFCGCGQKIDYSIQNFMLNSNKCE